MAAEVFNLEDPLKGSLDAVRDECATRSSWRFATELVRSHNPAEIQLRGPNGLSRVFRVGDTVRRNSNFWTPTIHVLLRHLENAGLRAAPKVLGTDEKGREILSFIAGDTPEHPGKPWNFRSVRALQEVAQMIRRFHDATLSFVPPTNAQWRGLVGAPNGGEVICHNDLGPFNVVFARGHPSAIIDWDNAAPGTRLWDIACALWRFAPLWGPDAWWGGDWEGNGWHLSLATKARRLKLFRDAYGPEFFPAWSEILDMIEARMRASELTVNARWEMFQHGKQFQLPDLGWLAKNRAELQELLVASESSN